MDRQLIVVRGCPGTGKSTLSTVLAQEAEAKGILSVICSCDDFFMVKGEYKFEGSKLALNHSKCLDKARKAIDQGINRIIIDNTNVCLSEFKAYIQYALNADYIVTLMEPDTSWAKSKEVDICMKMGTHNVPQQAYDRMLAKWEETDDILEEIADMLGCEVDIVSQSVWC